MMRSSTARLVLSVAAVLACGGGCRGDASTAPSASSPGAEPVSEASGASVGEGAADDAPPLDSADGSRADDGPPAPRLDGVARVRIPGINAPRDARVLAGIWQHGGQWVVATQRRDGRTEVLETWGADVATDGVVDARAIDRVELVSTRDTAPRLAVLADAGAVWLKPSDNLGQPDTRTVTFFARAVSPSGTVDPEAAAVDVAEVRFDREWGAASVGDRAVVCALGDDDGGDAPLATDQLDVWCFGVDAAGQRVSGPTRVFDATGVAPGVRGLHVGGGDGASFVAVTAWDGERARFAGAHVVASETTLEARVAEDLLGEPVPSWTPPRTGPWSWSDAGGSWWVVGGWGRHDDPTSRPPRAARVTADGAVVGRRQIPPPASFTDRPLMLRGAAGPWFVYDDYDTQGRRGIVGYTDDAAIPGVAAPPIGPAAATGQARNGVVSDGWAAMVHLDAAGGAVVAIVDAIAFGDPTRASSLTVEDPTGP